MFKRNSTAYKIAQLTSILGHPQITTSIYVIALTSFFLDENISFVFSFLIICGIIIPLTIQNYIKHIKNERSNFGISAGQQKRTFYPFLIFLVTIALIVIYVINQPKDFILGILFFLFMIISAYSIDLKIKCSLHTSFSFFIALAILKFYIAAGIMMMFFSVLIALSRLALKRYGIKEIVIGGLIGLVFGILNFVF